MISRDSNYSEVFEIFAEQMGADFLTKAADFELPPEMLDQIKDEGLDVGLGDVVAASHGPKLYGVVADTAEKMVGQAHPGGGTKMDLGSNDKELGKVETIVEQHKRNQDVALRMPKGKLASLVGKLAKLADVMDEAGFGEEAEKIEETMTALAATSEDYVPQPGEWHTTYSKKTNGGFSDTIVGADAAELEATSPETQALQQKEIARMKQESHNRIQQMNQKAVDLVNQHLARANVPAQFDVRSLTSALSSMGVSGYRNWNELFEQINQKAPGWAASRVAKIPPDAPESEPMEFTRQEASEADPDRGAAANLAAAERNRQSAQPGRSVQRQQPSHHTGA